MQKVIIEKGKTKYVDLTPEEESEVLERVATGEAEAEKEKRKKEDRNKLLDKLLKSASQDTRDLLKLLGFDTPKPGP